ncbi:MAG: UDP-N-acetylmuramate dehydrogenase [Candidatus Magasanikbacteria bacterium]
MYDILKKFGKVKVDEPLSKHTTFKLGGKAQFFVSVDDIEKLGELLQYLDGEGVPYFVLGGGSNVVVSDDGYEGVVISIQAKNIQIENDSIIADAGCPTVTVARESFSHGFTGFEWGVGVPGTIGGAVRGNAGAMGGDMKDSVEKVLVYRDGEVVEIPNAECDFQYRSSIFKREPIIILRVWLKLKKSGAGEKDGMKKALEYIQYRNTTQPQGFASSGCIFTNVQINEEVKKIIAGKEIPQEFLEKKIIPAGWLIEQAGMKGYTQGNIQVSEKHANFIVNLGGGNASDVFQVIDEIKTRVLEKFGIHLEEEVQIL